MTKNFFESISLPNRGPLLPWPSSPPLLAPTFLLSLPPCACLPNAHGSAPVPVVRLVFLTPRAFKVATLVTRVSALLQLKRNPILRFHSDEGDGAALDQTQTIGSYLVAQLGT